VYLSSASAVGTMLFDNGCTKDEMTRSSASMMVHVAQILLVRISYIYTNLTEVDFFQSGSGLMLTTPRRKRQGFPGFATRFSASFPCLGKVLNLGKPQDRTFRYGFHATAL
jgi:hypothetical protein